MREFNIFGPVYPDRHYHVNRVAVKNAIVALSHRCRST